MLYLDELDGLGVEFCRMADDDDDDDNPVCELHPVLEV